VTMPMRKEPQEYRTGKCEQCGNEITVYKFSPLGLWARRFCGNRCAFRFRSAARSTEDVEGGLAHGERAGDPGGAGSTPASPTLSEDPATTQKVGNKS